MIVKLGESSMINFEAPITQVSHNTSLSGKGTKKDPIRLRETAPSYASAAAAVAALGTGPSSFFWTLDTGCLYFKKPNSTSTFQIACF